MVIAVCEKEEKCRLYHRRWFMLLIFVLFSLMNSFQWVQYTILANVIVNYYNVEIVAVDWTSMIFMVAYIVFIIPAAHFLDKKGLRWSIILGTLGNAAGGCIKIASVRPDLFWVTFIGQTIVAMSSVFMLNVSPCVAAAWFGENEVSTACSLGMFGNEIGMALGFFIPTMIVQNNLSIEETSSELSVLFYITGGVSTAIFILAVFFFQDRPPTPPSPQQAKLKANKDISNSREDFLPILRRLFLNRNFVYLVLAYSLSQGVFSALSTLLNQIILSFFKDGEELAGRLGFVFVISGMIAGVLFGILLDKTHKFREISFAVFSLSLLGTAGFTVSLEMKSEISVYITATLLGSFLGGYMPIAYDFCAELTYPEPEGITSGMLAMPTQIFAILFIIICEQMIAHMSTTWMNAFLCMSLVIGTLIHIQIRADLKRHAVTNSNK
ncbi:hypothetical protein L9F63_004266 [Diploptera punctata]|uniref:Major facilitator superfamily (MFS) profile domain-containing protein n=1 Tax=Diploptera punctata TaxID=6984 RepID=A0AAD7ZG99_DIPPU|nr:hypothetical protein L9F63_004266 [Diploptera punctata]